MRRQSMLQWGHDDGVVEDARWSADVVPAFVIASMGPRRGVVEDGIDRRRLRARCACFNGATTRSRGRRDQAGTIGGSQDTLQWGHDDGVVEERDRVAIYAVDGICFNGATTRSRGRRRGERLSGDTSRCFNGATTRSRGRRHGVIDQPMAADIASMGPRRRSRGRASDVSDRPPRIEHGFNGATTMESWKTTVARDDPFAG